MLSISLFIEQCTIICIHSLYIQVGHLFNKIIIYVVYARYSTDRLNQMGVRAIRKGFTLTYQQLSPFKFLPQIYNIIFLLQCSGAHWLCANMSYVTDLTLSYNMDVTIPYFIFHRPGDGDTWHEASLKRFLLFIYLTR